MALMRWTNAVEWLAAASREPGLCKSDWQHGTTGIRLLAAGRFWDVLIVPACLGLRTADVLSCVPRVEPGPALLDSRRQHVGFFLPHDPSSIWPDTTSVTSPRAAGSQRLLRTAAGVTCAGSVHPTDVAP